MSQKYPDFRLYGEPPYQTAVVHGGPGGPGELQPLAEELSKTVSIIEPLQKQDSVDGQVEELQKVIKDHCNLPITLIGWSWGAFLSFIMTAKHPELVKKLILISSGPFTKEYAEKIQGNRAPRLSKEAQNKDFKESVKAIFLADMLDPIVSESPSLECQYELNQKVWSEAQSLRSSGRLLACGSSILCPVVAIHGDYDPRPFEGIRDPLSQVLKNFRFILLESCGHHPWYERNAKDKFYEILREEIL